MSITSRKSLLLTVTGTLALSIIASLVWWNTNIFGKDTLCQGRVKTPDLAAALDTKGRISSDSTQGGPGYASFRCTVERTSKFIGAPSIEAEIKTSTNEADAQFQTHVWKNPSSMSFFSRGATGAVSEKRGWVMLPSSCQKKVGLISLGSTTLPRENEVNFVEAVVRTGHAAREELAQLLVNVARKVADSAGCLTEELDAEFTLQDPQASIKTDQANACGITGFSLPKTALVPEKATLGQETVSGSVNHSWACDMHFGGNSDSQATFSMSTDPNVISGVKQGLTDFQELPGKAGYSDQNSRLLLKCEAGEVYFGMKWDREYLRLMLDQGRDDISSRMRTLFQAFLDAAAKQHRCPSVILPTEQERSEG
ncbi:hypothetical protein [Streptomyces sp. MUM 178J]|uniref:hypothetical protein n=1 Tax=Streptomyces sp. MUM 178J TaxID=2791991 RepID=UPI001F035BBE|nr:hypothetical protein [Streptomyces sp. MUM 178J]WRQ80921.1 hypothetical protein I3F59_017020 [Streptomyces sp. MUM 178J]